MGRLKNQQPGFKTGKAVWEHLRAKGYTISLSKVQNDVQQGLLARGKDKTFSRAIVDGYEKNLAAIHHPASKASKNQDSSESKTHPERMAILKERRLELQIRREEIETRNQDEAWLLKDEAWAAIAALVGTIHDSLLHNFRKSSEKIATASGGQSSRAIEAYEECSAVVAEAFNEISRTGSIDVIFDKED